MCGNGLCEAPEEYQSVGRFGCLADCGLLFNRSTLRVDLAAAWEVPGNPFAALRNKSVFGTGSLPVGFRCGRAKRNRPSARRLHPGQLTYAHHVDFIARMKLWESG